MTKKITKKQRKRLKGIMEILLLEHGGHIDNFCLTSSYKGYFLYLFKRKYKVIITYVLLLEKLFGIPVKEDDIIRTCHVIKYDVFGEGSSIHNTHIRFLRRHLLKQGTFWVMFYGNIRNVLHSCIGKKEKDFFEEIEVLLSVLQAEPVISPKPPQEKVIYL
jgi:hypothetical protein